jgi:hypothetical protein
MPENYLFPLERRPGEDDWERALAQAAALINRYLDMHTAVDEPAANALRFAKHCTSFTGLFYGRSPN